jgi:putative membrane protein
MFMILKVILYALLIIGITYVVPGISVAGFWPAAVIAGLAFALLNAIVRAIVPNALLFIFIAIILNAIAFWIIGMYVPGFDVATVMSAVIGSIIASIGVWIINQIF